MFFLIGEAIASLNYYVAMFLPPAVFALGGLGNIFSLLVFILSPLRKLRSSPFLIGLTVAHLVALSCIFLVWLEKFNVFLVGYPGWCQVLNYLFHVANFLGVAFVLCFTVERYISFCWNRNANSRASGTSMHRKCVVVTIVLVVLVGLMYSFLFGLLAAKSEKCKFIPIPGYNRSSAKISKYMIRFTHIISGFMLLVTLGLDICIMITILRRNREQKDGSPKFDSRSLQKDFSESVDNLSIGQADDLAGVGGGRDTYPRSKVGTLPRPLRIIRSRELRRSRSLLSIRSTINATRMLFAASLTFTLLQMFFAGIQFFQALLFLSKRPLYEFSEPVYNIFVSMYIISLAIGFVIYMFCGYNFREAVKMLLTCQYGRGCAHSCCKGRRSKRRSPTVTEDTDAERSTPVAIDSVSRYMDDASHISVRPS